MRIIALLLVMLFTRDLRAQATKTINTTDFKKSLGAWTGTLTYLDYSSGKPFTMPANVTLSEAPGSLVLSFTYPKEPKANGNDTLRISNNGAEFEKAAVVSRKVLADGSLEIVTEKNGRDGNDNKRAILRHTYLFGDKKFSNTKEVKFEGEEKWILRNVYSFMR